jgi:hypothetical protein
MPASSAINSQKSNRLVTQEALHQASDRITDWWERAFFSLGDDARQRFFVEAGQTLPMLGTAPDPHDVIEAMKLQRMRLAKDQGLRPWTPTAGRDITNERLAVQPRLGQTG